MCKRLSLFIFSIVFLLVNASTSSAAEKWIDKSYDFSSVKSILVMEPVFKSEPESEMVEKNVKQIFNDNLKFKNVKVYDLNRIDLLITAQTGEDIRSLRKTDPQLADELFNRYVGDYVDLILYTWINEYNIGSVYREAHYESETKYETITVYDKQVVNGQTHTIERKVSVPRTYDKYVPATYVRVISSDVYFKLVNAKNDESVMLFSEERSKVPGLFEETTPINLYTRTVKAFFKELNKKIK